MAGFRSGNRPDGRPGVLGLFLLQCHHDRFTTLVGLEVLRPVVLLAVVFFRHANCERVSSIL